MMAAETRADRTSSIESVYRSTSARYCDSAFKYMRHLQQLGKYCDVTVRVAETQYYAHKVILAAASQDFADLLDGEEDQLDVVDLNDMSPAVFEIILEYAYSGNVIITNENVGDLFEASKVLGIGTLAAACSEALPVVLTTSNCCRIKAIAGEQHSEEVYNKCQEYALEHFTEIVAMEEFLELPIDQVKALVANPGVLLEQEVYSAMLKWVKHDFEHRKHYLFELMEDVKFTLMDREFFTNNVIREPMLRTDFECTNLLLETTKFFVGMQREHLKKQPVSYIFATGGFSKFRSQLHECEVYNPTTNEWHPIASMQSKRESHAVIGVGQYLYAFGGYNEDEKVLSTVEFYDPIKHTWTWTTPLSYGRQAHGICALNDSIFICGGLNESNDSLSTVEQFDLSTGRYKMCAAMRTNRTLFKMVAIGDCIYAIGGWNEQALDSVERFDPREGIWSRAPSMSRSRSALGVAVLNEYIYCTGGYGRGRGNSSGERFDIRKSAWEPIPNMLNGRRGHELVAIDSCVYAIGGLEMNSVERFDPDTNQWVEMSSMLQRRWSLGASTLNGIEINHS